MQTIWLWQFVLGIGIGPTLAVFTIVVQNAVPFRKLGVATSNLTFFRQIGGTIGLSIAGSLFGTQLTNLLPERLVANGIPQQFVDQLQAQGGGAFDLNNLVGVGTDLGAAILAKVPEQAKPIVEPLIPNIVTSIYEAISFAIASVFWLGVVAAVVAFVAVLVIRELPLRTSLGPAQARPAEAAPVLAESAPPRLPRPRRRDRPPRPPDDPRRARPPDDPRRPHAARSRRARARPGRPSSRCSRSPTCRRARSSRVTRGDLDLLLAHLPDGIVATDDRCPHMAAPLSIGRLDGCVVDCPLHNGRFDLATGETVQMPTTGGLDADGGVAPDVVAAGLGAEAGAGRPQGRGAPPDADPAPPLLPRPHRRRAWSRSPSRAPEAAARRRPRGAAVARRRCRRHHPVVLPRPGTFDSRATAPLPSTVQCVSASSGGSPPWRSPSGLSRSPARCPPRPDRRSARDGRAPSSRPTTIRVYRTATRRTVTVPFRTYVEKVMAAEWGPTAPAAALRVGAVAVKQFAWYYAIYWRGGRDAAGRCYDVRDSSIDQVYDPRRTTVASHAAAVAATWRVSLRKGDRFFLTGYRPGTGVCTAHLDGWKLYQRDAVNCVRRHGDLAESLARRFFSHVSWITPGAGDYTGDGRGDLAVVSVAPDTGETTARVYTIGRRVPRRVGHRRTWPGRSSRPFPRTACSGARRATSTATGSPTSSSSSAPTTAWPSRS